MLSEESLELIVQDHLAELEWVSGHGPDFAPGSGERDTWNDIVLRGRGPMRSILFLPAGVMRASISAWWMTPLGVTACAKFPSAIMC